MVYVLAQFSITDPKSYQRYTERFMGTLKPFRGSVLIADPQPKPLEGDWNHDKVVLLSFADEATFHAWYNSEPYQEITKDRWASTSGSVLLLKAFSSPVGLLV